MPSLVVVERDYSAVADKLTAIGPLLEELGATTKDTTFHPGPEIDYLKRQNGVVRTGAAAGRPSIERADQACEAVLALSGTTNGRLAVQGFQDLEVRTGMELADLAGERAGDRVTFADTQLQPRTLITSPEWSGIEAGGRRYAPFTINVERKKPWHTLTGRQHFFLDHDWIIELGEGLPTFRPSIAMHRHFPNQGAQALGAPEVRGRYLTPHSKWSIHSEYQENLHMLTLSRGGPVIWMSGLDAAKIGVADNEWVEAYNRNGIVSARTVVTHKMPEGTVYMYHVKDRHLDTPRTEMTGRRGGTDNSLTRLLMKPSHLIGGYAQLSYGFNYYGPTGSQRDEVAVIRRRNQKVSF